jgi:hypothetical protein
MSQHAFFRFSTDETSLHAFFASAEDNFKRHELLLTAQDQRIHELSGQIRYCAERPDMQPQIESRITDLSAAINRVERSLAATARLWETLGAQIQIVNRHFAAELSSLETRLTDQRNSEVREFAAKFTRIWSENLGEIQTKIDEHCQSLTHCNSLLTERLSAESKALRGVLAREQQINGRLEALSGELEQLKNRSQFERLTADIECLKRDRPSFPIRPPSPDLELLELRVAPPIDSSSPPVLPPLHKFCTVAQAVDYLYELVPTLQSILTSTHHSVDARFAELLCHDWGVSDMKADLINLTTTIQGLATRKELNAALPRRCLFRECDSPGLSKCISCGRPVADPGITSPRKAGGSARGLQFRRQIQIPRT